MENSADAMREELLQIYLASNELNKICAAEIETAIDKTSVPTGMPGANHYDFESALAEVTEKFGAERVNTVLASTVNLAEWDGRYSNKNKDWAKKIQIPHKENRSGCYVNTHPAILDGFISHARKEWEKVAIGTPEDEITVNTQSELDKISLDYEGKIMINGGSFEEPIIVASIYKNEVTAMRNSFVELQNNAKVTAKDRAKIFAYDYSEVTAKNGFTLPPVEAHGNSTVYANDTVTVYAYDDSTINAYHDSEVVAYDNTKVIANDRAGIIAHDNSSVEVMNKDVIVNAADNVAVTVDAIVYDKPKIMLSGNAVVKESIKEQAQKRSIRKQLKEPLPKSATNKSVKKAKSKER